MTVGLRLVDLEIAVDEIELTAGARLVQQRLRHLVEVGKGLGGIDHELDWQTLGSRQRRKLECRDPGAGDFVPFDLQLLLELGRAPSALIPGLEQHAADALVDRRNAGELEHLRVFGKLARNLVQLVGVHLHLIGRRIGRPDHLVQDDALVLRRRQFGLGGHEQSHRRQEQDKPHHQHHRPRLQDAREQPLVPAAQVVELVVDELREARLPAGALKQARTHHRREGQGDNARDRHRAREREGELGEQRAGQSALESDRHVHRHQDNGHRQDRAAELARGDQRRHPAGVAALLVDVPEDILHHDDGVIDHQPDGQDQGQQREQIDRVSQASIMKNVPTSDSGMATTGMATARTLPRNRKITAVTISNDSPSVLMTS